MSNPEDLRTTSVETQEDYFERVLDWFEWIYDAGQHDIEDLLIVEAICEETDRDLPERFKKEIEEYYE